MLLLIAKPKLETGHRPAGIPGGTNVVLHCRTKVDYGAKTSRGHWTGGANVVPHCGTKVDDREKASRGYCSQFRMTF